MKKSKIYYTKFLFEQLMPQIATVSNQSRYGYHGLSHTIQVAQFGIDISLDLKINPLPVLLACGLHDCARTNDEWCTKHGPNAVPIAHDFFKKYYPSLSERDIMQISYAVENHTTGLRAPDAISACLWDSDRIRLSWESGYSPRFFSTKRGHEIASMTKQAQQEYINAQDKFLIENNIKTRELIEFERQQDMLQNIYGTEFKTR